MYELVQITARDYYINSPAKVGVWLSEPGVAWLIDSGNDKDAGKKIFKVLDGKGWRLKGIINTHSNADHIGGNQYLQRLTGCPVFTTGMEAAFTKYPILETSFLYGGYPPKDLRHKFLMANESAPREITDPDFPEELMIIPLPGHFFGMIGLKTPDGTAYIADSYSSSANLQKYKVSFIYDVAQYLATLDMLGKMEAKIFVPAHAETTADVGPITAENRAMILEIARKILEICKEPAFFEKILQRIFVDYSLEMNFEQYVLVGSTIRSYLAWLRDTGKMDVSFENGWLLWKTTGEL